MAIAHAVPEVQALVGVGDRDEMLPAGVDLDPLVPASEPELPVTPTVTADAEPEDLMYSAVDLARPKG